MNTPKKKSFGPQVMPSQVKAQTARANRFQPVVAQLKNDVAQNTKRTVAPLACHSQRKPIVAQAKLAALSPKKPQLVQTPKARLQSVPKVLQTKAAALKSPEKPKPHFGPATPQAVRSTAVRQPRVVQGKYTTPSPLFSRTIQRANEVKVKAAEPVAGPPPEAPKVEAPKAEAKESLKTEAELIAAIEKELAAMEARDLVAGKLPRHNTGYNGFGKKTEMVDKATFEKVRVWWQARKEKIKGKAVQYAYNVSLSLWDRVDPNVTLDLVAQEGGAGGGFNFHIVVKDYFKK